MHKENLDKSPKLGHFVTSVAVKLYISNSRFFFFFKTLKIRNYALKCTCFKKKKEKLQ